MEELHNCSTGFHGQVRVFSTLRPRLSLYLTFCISLSLPHSLSHSLYLTLSTSLSLSHSLYLTICMSLSLLRDVEVSPVPPQRCGCLNFPQLRPRRLRRRISDGTQQGERDGTGACQAAAGLIWRSAVASLTPLPLS